MADVIVEPSVLVGDATCPQCGQLLWFFQTTEIAHVFDAQRSSPSKKRVIDIIAERLGVDAETIANNPRFGNDLGTDSLDTVELVMELEQEFNLP